MKVCCLIDSLGSGGAQRQMTWLVKALVEQGYQVRLLLYHSDFDHFLPAIRESGISPEYINAASKLGRFMAFRRRIRRDKPDCVISFLNTPNLLAIFSALKPDRIPVIVSERSLQVGSPTFTAKLRFNAYRLADRVVTNSIAQRTFIETRFPFLKRKMATITNCVDLSKFRPNVEDREIGQGIKVLVAASVIPVKNTHRFIQAVKLANDQLEHPIHVDWYGNNLFVDDRPTPGSEYFLKSVAMVDELGIKSQFVFHDTVNDLHDRFSNYDVVCLPSLYEGCPNVVCEAMASGLPVLCSDVSDLRQVLDNPSVLFDPRDIRSIAATLVDFARTPVSDRKGQSNRNRQFAEEHFSPVRFFEQFDGLVRQVVDRTRGAS